MWPIGAMGESPANAHRNFRPCHRFRRAGINTMYSAADGLLPISVSAHLRFSFKPIVKIAPILSVAEFVKLVGTLPNLLLKLLDRFSQLPFFHALWAPLFHSGVPPAP